MMLLDVPTQLKTVSEAGFAVEAGVWQETRMSSAVRDEIRRLAESTTASTAHERLLTCMQT
jgi:hypothetical protein